MSVRGVKTTIMNTTTIADIALAIHLLASGKKEQAQALVLIHRNANEVLTGVPSDKVPPVCRTPRQAQDYLIEALNTLREARDWNESDMWQAEREMERCLKWVRSHLDGAISFLAGKG